MTWNDPHNQAPLPTAPGQVPPFRMADWLVLPDQNRLVRSGVHDNQPSADAPASAPPASDIHVEPRIMHVLVCLAARPGAVLSRNELLDTVWDEVVVKEEALTHAVSQLRRILGDDSRSAHAIETIRKRGYRLLLPVAAATPEPEPAQPAQPAVSPATPPPRRRVTPGILAAVGAGAVLLAVLLMWAFGPGQAAKSPTSEPSPATPSPATPSPATPSPATLVRPATSLEGSEIFPALSPDATLLAFSHAARGTNDYDLFVTPVAGGEPTRLTDQPGVETDATWSPTGETVAFVRHHDGRHQVLCVPAIGGREQTLLADCPDLCGLDWDPSGQALCLGLRQDDAPRAPGFALCELTLPDRTLRPLTTPPPLHDDIMPAYAPDGATVAFVRLDFASLATVQLLDRRTGRARAVGTPELAIQGLTWLADGRSLVYGCMVEGRYVLKQLHLPSGRTELLQAQRDWVFFPRAARRVGALAYEERKLARDILATALDDDQPGTADAQVFLDSTQPDFGPRFSPSGTQVAFLSLRSGRLAFWLCEADGSQAHELSAPRGLSGRRFDWSPDGRRLAGTVLQAGVLRTCLVDARTGASHLLGDGAGHMIFRAWAHDGAAIMCQVTREGELASARFDLATGRLHDLPPLAARVLGDTPDGFFYGLPADPDIWFMPHQGDPAAARSFALPREVRPSSLICRSGALLFATTDGEETTIRSLSPTTGRQEEISRIAGMTGPNLDLSPDGRTLLHERSEVLQVDVMLMPRIH